MSALAEDSPLTKPRQIFVGEKMRVILLPDPNFQIRAKGSDLRENLPDTSATWQWDVRPLRPGSHMLVAQVDVLKKEASGKLSIYKRYSRRVSVSVGVGPVQTLIDRIQDAKSVGDALSALFRSWRIVLLALAALLAAALSVRVAYRKLRERRERRTAQEYPADDRDDVSQDETPPEG